MAVDVPTFDEVYAAGRTEVLARNAALTDWTPGSALDALIGAGAVAADEACRVLISLFAAQFVDTAEGDDLDALALDRFNLERNPASAAVVTLTFTRGGSSGTLTIPAGTTCSATVNGVSYLFETDEEVEIAALDSEVDVTATCTVTGRGGNVAAGTIETIVDTIAGDSTATVTNDAAAAGGDVEETDPAFRDRIRRFFNTLRKGTVGALEAGALSVPGVSFVTVDESLIAPEDGGYVAVYVGDPDGTGNSALAEDVETELEDWRAAGVEVRVFGSAREGITLGLTVYVEVGADLTTMLASVRAAVLGVTDNLAPRETMYLSKIVAAVHNVSTTIVNVVIADPATDAAPSASQNAIRVNDEDLSVTIVEVT